MCPYQYLHKDPAPPPGTPHSKGPGILPALDTSCLHCLNCFLLLTKRIQAHCSEPNTERYQERKKQRSLEFQASETEFMSRNLAQMGERRPFIELVTFFKWKRKIIFKKINAGSRKVTLVLFYNQFHEHSFSGMVEYLQRDVLILKSVLLNRKTKRPARLVTRMWSK